jgi:hypothetical protein
MSTTPPLRVLALLLAGACGGSPRATPVALTPPPPIPPPSAADTPDLAPSPHRENARIVPEILEALRGNGAWKNDEIVGARVSSRSWEPARNPLTGRLVARTIEADVFVRARRATAPEACRRYLLRFSRDGAGGSLSWIEEDGAGHAFHSGDASPFPCSKAPK